MEGRGALTLLCLVCAWAPSVLAATPRLDWSAPTMCPGRTDVAAEIQALVGDALEAAWPPALRVAGVVTAQAGTYRLELTVEDEAGRATRSLGPEPSCRTLAYAAALIVAIAIDPSLAVAPAGATARLSPATGPAPDGPPTTGAAGGGAGERAAVEVRSAPEEGAAAQRTGEPAAERGAAGGRQARPSTPRSWPMIRVGAAGDVGSLPAATLGLLAALAWARRELRAEAGFSLWLARQTSLSPSGPTADVSLTAGTLRGCARVSAWRAEPWICAGVEVGWMHGTGHGVTAPQDGGALWLAATSGLALSIRLARSWSFWVDVGPILALVRPRFFFEDLGDVHQPSRVAGRAQATVEWRPQ